MSIGFGLLCASLLFGRIEPNDPAGSLLAWYGDDWEEYSDLMPLYWSFETWQVNLESLTVPELAALPGMDLAKARSFDAARRTTPPNALKKLLAEVLGVGAMQAPLYDHRLPGMREPFTARIHLRTRAGYGGKADEASERYDGSRTGVTQRYFASWNRIQTGLIVDKDPFEANAFDLSRYWAAWRDELGAIVAGDFHVTTGLGAVLWTKPVYRNSYDAAGSYRLLARGVQPASDSWQNSALRGIALDRKSRNLKLNLFVAYTPLDAIVTDSSRVLRLTDNGFHRSEAERRKRNSVREFSGGGSLNRFDINTLLGELSLGLTGYLSRYKPKLQPDPDRRIPFPLKGRHAGAFGINGSLSGDDYTVRAEVARDLHADYTLISTAHYAVAGSVPVTFDLFFHRFPKSFQSPRSRNYGSTTSNNTVAALLLSGRRPFEGLEWWKAHIEVERRGWRSYTVPTPSQTSRASLEAQFLIGDGSSLSLRYRRKTGDDGRGEALPPESYLDQRLRIALRSAAAGRPSLEFRSECEGAVRKVRDGAAGDQAHGLLINNRLSLSFPTSRRSRGYLRCRLGACLYWTTNSLPVYIGEADLPDRVSSVVLSGEGMRWLGSLIWHTGPNRWFGVKAAKTIRWAGKGYSSDLELFATVSYRFISNFQDK